MSKRGGRSKKIKSKGKTPERAERFRVRLWQVVLAVAVGGVALSFWWQPRPAGGLPSQLTRGAAAGFNVLLITMDTTRADHLGCYGYDGVKTPALDGLAQAGIRFADAVTSAPITAPAHTTILTGLDPSSHGVRNNGMYVLSDDKTTIAELLGAKGYETAAFTSAFVLDARFGLNQGFEVYNDDIGVATSLQFSFHENANQRSAFDVTSAVVDWLKGRDRSRPFFSWVHYYDPHKPYKPPPPFDAAYPDRPYDGEIAYMDSQIARLLAALESTGHSDRLLTIVTSDHGEGLGEHREETHARLIYGSVMRAPLILTCPALFDGPYVVDGAVVSVADVFPTILELLGVPSAGAIDGISLLQAGADPDRMVLIESMASFLENGWSPLFGLRRHHDKYILAPRPEYYDLHSDPDELSDLYLTGSRHQTAARDMLVAELATRLEQWPDLAKLAAAATQPDAKTVQRLQSLGYLGQKAGNAGDSELPDPKDMMVVLRRLDLAEAAMNSGRLEEALQIINSAADMSPRDLRVNHLTGKILLGLGREAEAEEAFQTANSLHPTADAYLLLGQIRIKNGRYDEAVEALDQAAALAPQHGGVLIARGDLLMIHQRPHDAMAAYERAAKVDPYRLGQVARARIARLQKALDQASAP